MKVKLPATTTQKYSPRWWKHQLIDAEKRHEQFVRAAEESIKVYNAIKQIDSLKDAQRRLNVWWYCVNTLLPAYYSSTPKAEVNLRKRAGGVPYELGSVIIERNTQYSMDCHFDFDKVGCYAALQFLLTGQAVLWARYVPKFEKIFQEIAIIKDPSGAMLTADGNPFDGELGEVKEVNGILIASVEVEQKVDEKAILEVVAYNDYRCSDARDESEIEWQARRAYLDEYQAEERFGPEIAKALSYSTHPEVSKQQLGKREDRNDGKAEIWEVWCEKTNRVYWMSLGYEKIIIEESEPAIKFERFYPCSVIRQSIDPDSIVPVSDYSHVKDQILEVERLTTRIHAMTQAVRANFAYDSAMGQTIQQLFEDDLKGLPVDNWPSNRGRGGLQGSIEFAPIEAFVNTLNVLQQNRQTALQQLYETLKVSDLLRGTSEQYKSATANRLESQWSSMGLIVRQNQFTKFMSDAIMHLGTIICEQFDDARILEIGDARSLIEQAIYVPQPEPMPQTQPGMPMGEPGMEMPMPPMQPSPEQLAAELQSEILGILRDNKLRNYRIQIASDSMVAIDQQQQQAEGTMLIQSAGAFFDQMRGLVDQYPPLVEFSISLMQNMIKRFKGGKELDGIFTKALQQIGEIAKAKEEAAKQPPPPDPTMQEVQGRLQIAQIEAQARLQTAQIEAQDRQVKNQIEMQNQQLKAQRDQLEAQLSIQKQQSEEYLAMQQLTMQQQELQIKQSSVEVDMLKVQTSAQSEADKAMIKQEHGQMQHILEIQKLELEQMRVKLSEAEKLMEERRLASDQAIERVRLSMESIQRQPAGAIMVTTDKPMVIEKEKASKPKKRRGKIITDETGNPIGIDIEDITE